VWHPVLGVLVAAAVILPEVAFAQGVPHSLTSNSVPGTVAAEQQAGLPSLRAARIAAQLAAGFGGELAGFFVGAPVGAGFGAGLATITPLPTAKSAVAGGVIGAYAGIAAGAATAVYFVGRTDEQTASFGATLAGAGAGVAAGIVIKQLSHTAVGRFLYNARPILALPPVGATIGFALSRKLR